MEIKYTMGIDVGSTASKCVIVKGGKEIAATSLVHAGAGSSGPAKAIKEVLEKAGLQESDLSYILATGYGRHQLSIARSQMSELSCHARGAYELFPDVRTVIDIGGQDAKVLRISAGGNLDNFVMNDKCAAGTGRFLEVMARILEMDISQMAEFSRQSAKRVDISSTCTVFAESEVISQLAGGSDKCDILKGIHRSVAGRVSGLVRRVGVVDTVVMTGGVAQNSGVREALEEELKVTIVTSPLAQYTGALGAALFAYQKCIKEGNMDVTANER